MAGTEFRIIPNIDNGRTRATFAVRCARTVRSDLDGQLNERLATRGFRFTPSASTSMLCCCGNADHPTAEEVFIRAKREMPDISMATVYNCLDALVECGLARQVTLERAPRGSGPNMPRALPLLLRTGARVSLT